MIFTLFVQTESPHFNEFYQTPCDDLPSENESWKTILYQHPEYPKIYGRPFDGLSTYAQCAIFRKPPSKTQHPTFDECHSYYFFITGCPNEFRTLLILKNFFLYLTNFKKLLII